MGKKTDVTWPSFKKHYIRVTSYSALFTLLQYLSYFYIGMEGKTEQGFFKAFGLLYILLGAVLVLELYALPYHYISKKVNFKQLVSHFAVFIIVICYLFASVFNTIYLLDAGSFTGSIAVGFFHSFFDFFCYSVGLLSGSGLSEIRPNSFWAKLCSILESFLFFYIIIILLANNKDVGKSKFGSSIDIISEK